MSIITLRPELANEIKTNFILQNNNNKARIKELRRYATDGFAKVFDMVPVLLNINEPDQVGYIASPETPCGIKFIDQQLWRPKSERIRDLTTSARPRPAVESLFLMGSSGSVGHTATSDLDYWVCYDPQNINGHPLELFRQKLESLTAWARHCHQTEANFYLINMVDLLQGHFARHEGGEADGEVAPHLLLEELYRTYIYVAGRPPLWPGLPLTLDENEYQCLSVELAGDQGAQYIDLGFPAGPSPQELLAEALWLARKSEADPFKGIIKMATLLDFVESGPDQPLLCHQVKEAILAAQEHELPVDPYVKTIERVEKFGRGHLPPEQLDLLRVAAALKILGILDLNQTGVPQALTPKSTILTAWAASWGWQPARLDHLAIYNQWPQRERLALGGELLNMLANVYVRIAQYLLHHYPGQLNPQEEDLAPLAARLLSRMTGLEATVETLPAQIYQNRISQKIILYHQGGGGQWSLHAVTESEPVPRRDNLIYSAPRAARVAGWLVHNQILGPETHLAISSEPQSNTALDGRFDEMLKKLNEVFPVFNPTLADLDTLWSASGPGDVVLALNFEQPLAECGNLREVDIILRTGWGEMRHYYLLVAEHGQNADKYLQIVEKIAKETGGKQVNPVFIMAPVAEMQKAAMNIRAALTALGRRGRPKKTRLDV